MLNAYGPGGNLSNIGGPSNDPLNCFSPIYQPCAHDHFTVFARISHAVEFLVSSHLQ